MRSLHLPAHARGSSLVETLVATVLGLLALVLTTNTVLAVVVGENRTVTAKALLATVQFARDQAAQRGTPVAICGLDPRDAHASSGDVHCARSGAAWDAGWIVYGDADMNGQLDDGEVVLQVTRGPHPAVHAQDDVAGSSGITFRPIGTLASTTPRRLLIGTDGARSAICVGIDGYTRIAAASAPCR